MNTAIQALLPTLCVLIGFAVVFGCFWGADLISRRLVKTGIGRVVLTFVFGCIIFALVIVACFAGCILILGSPNFH